MKTFLMICHVAATFKSLDGKATFKVEANKLGDFVMAPECIKETLLFKGLVKDGSITVAKNDAEQKKLENEPMDGISAEGKSKEITEAAETADEAPVRKARTSKKKGEK